MVAWVDSHCHVFMLDDPLGAVDRAINDGIEWMLVPGVDLEEHRRSGTAFAREVRNSWWYGWGLRKVPGGWMFNNAGYGAVELRLASGRVFRIGTDEPDAVLSAIESARSVR